MENVIEERIIIDMYHKEGKSHNYELSGLIENILTNKGYRRAGVDFTLKNGVKFYFSKEN